MGINMQKKENRETRLMSRLPRAQGDLRRLLS